MHMCAGMHEGSYHCTLRNCNAPPYTTTVPHCTALLYCILQNLVSSSNPNPNLTALFKPGQVVTARIRSTGDDADSYGFDEQQRRRYEVTVTTASEALNDHETWERQYMCSVRQAGTRKGAGCHACQHKSACRLCVCAVATQQTSQRNLLFTTYCCAACCTMLPGGPFI